MTALTSLEVFDMHLHSVALYYFQIESTILDITAFISLL